MRSEVSKTLKIAVACLVVAAALSGASVADTTLAPVTFSITGTSATVSMVASATWTGSIYHYQYVLTYDTHGLTSKRLSGFSVQNNLHLAFYNATTDQPSYFTSNPVYDPTDINQNSILWSASPVPSPTVVTFSFDSPWAYNLVDVTASGGGWVASLPQATLGLVPEPAFFSVFAAGALGMGLRAVRRRRR